MKTAISRKNIWDSTPGALKSMLGTLLGPVPQQWLLGKGFRKHYKFIQEAEGWSMEHARRYQLNKLHEILKLAYQKTGYYRRLFDSIGFYPNDLHCLEDMNELPTIDKQTVVNNLSDMCTRSIKTVDVDFTSTGGTSGTPIRFYINADRSSIEYAYLTKSWERTGYRLGMPMVVLRSRVVQPDGNGLRHEYDPLLRHHYYSNFHMSEDNMARYLEHIATIGPCFLHVYPSSVAALARHILRKGVQPPKNIRGIIAESEIVYPEQRRMVEDVFGCRCFSCYGHSEKLVLAAECEHSNDYHVWPAYGYFELLDENGKSVTKPGQKGEIVGTGFINTVMPFIRYRTGDCATYVNDHCRACGREHIIIREIQGHRTQEVLIALDGSEISWTALNMHDDTFLGVKQFQFMQEKPGRAVLRLVPADGFVEEDINRIHRNLGKKLEGRINFTIELVDSIALSARGKAVYVDQRISSDN
jgi:phenylacetate-CoA ligase